MTKVIIGVGVILTALGIIGYFATGAVSFTALIPTVVGLLLLACAALAWRTSWHRHGMHAALVVALLGALGSLTQVAKLGAVFAGTAQRPAAVILSTVMFVLLLVVLVVGVRSFVTARRARG